MKYPPHFYSGCNVMIETSLGSNGKWRWSASITNDSSENVEKIVLPVEYDSEGEAFDDARMIAELIVHRESYALGSGVGHPLPRD
jgi:hypothetical protein